MTHIRDNDTFGQLRLSSRVRLAITGRGLEPMMLENMPLAVWSIPMYGGGEVKYHTNIFFNIKRTRSTS